MKSCPTCQRRYVDDTLKFCLDDGSLLAEDLAPTRSGQPPEATYVLPSQPTEPPPTIRNTQQSTMTSWGVEAGGNAAGSLTAANGSGNGRGRGLLWIALALIIGGSGIAIAFILSRGRQVDNASASQSPSSIANPSPAESSNTNASPPSTVSNQSANRSEPVLTKPKVDDATRPPAPTPVIREKVETKAEQPASTPQAPRGPVSGGVLNGKAVSLVKPAYPPMARSVHASGAVVVSVLIDEGGNVISASAVSGHPLLRSAAAAAARSSKFSPTILGGQPVKVTGTINYNFEAQ